MTFAEYKQAHKTENGNEHFLWDFIGNLEEIVNEADSVTTSVCSVSAVSGYGGRAGYVMILNVVKGEKVYRFDAVYSPRFEHTALIPSMSLSWGTQDRKSEFCVGKNGWELLDGDNPLGFKVGDILTLVRYIEELERAKNSKGEKWWE